MFNFNWSKSVSSTTSRRTRRHQTRKARPPERRRARFEFLEDRRVLAVLTVNSVGDVAADTSALTLRDAITLVNNAGDPASLGQSSMPATWASQISNLPFGSGDTVQFDPSLFGSTPETIGLAGRELLVTKNLSIVGTGADYLNVSGQNQSRVLEAANGANVRLTGLSVTNGNGVPGNPAGLHANRGGGIVVDESSSLTATDCDVSGNAVTIGPLGGGLGGGIADYGTLTVSNSKLAGNQANTTYGGGIAVFGTPVAPATLTVNQSTLEQNTAYQNGGGIALATPNCTATITNSLFYKNATTIYDGGAITIRAGNAIVTGCTFTDNTAAENGGGIANFARMTINNSSFHHNSALDYGGGLTTGGGSNTTLNGDTFDQINSAAVGGGISNFGTLFVSGSTLSTNSANDGGGVFDNFSSVTTINNSTLSGNTATQGGGGIYNSSNDSIPGGTEAILTIVDSTLSGNSASSGGGISNFGVTSISDSTLAGNTAVYGGGIDNYWTLTISGSTISGNSAGATGVGGGIDNAGLGSGLNTWKFSLADSIIAGNTASLFWGPDVWGQLDTGFNNLIENAAGIFSGGISDGVNGNHIGLTSAQIGLAPLTNNGGPTQTMALLPGSLAIGAGVAPDQLATALGPGDASLSLASPADLALVPGSTVLRIDGEQLLVTGVSGSLITVTRGYNGTAAAAHAAEAGVYSALDQRGVLRADSPSIGAYEAVTLSADTAALNLGTTTYGAAGTITTYTLSGNALAGNVVVTAPAGVELSTDGTNWASSLTLTPSTTTLGGNGTTMTLFDTIDVRISAGVAAGNLNGVIQNTSGGAGELDLQVSGVVSQAGTATTLSSSSANVPYGTSVTFTATVAVVAPGAGAPTGTVTFWDGGTQLATAALNAAGQATFTTSNLTVATHTITAVYSGDTNFVTSTSAALSQSVLSAQQEATATTTQVQTLVASGALKSGNGNSLIATLNAATASLNRGNTVVGVVQLGVFIAKVEVLALTRRLDAADAQTLIADATAAIAAAVDAAIA